MKQFFVTIIAALALAGCVGGTDQFLGELWPDSGSPTAFRDANYQAADALGRQLTSRSHTGIRQGTLDQVAYGQRAAPDSAFSRLVMQSVTSRLVANGETLSPEGTAVLHGDYMLSRRDVMIHLEVTDNKSGQILAATDYSLPLNDETESYLGANTANALPASTNITP